MTYRTLCHAVGHQVLPTHPVIPHPPVDYHQFFRPILYFQLSPAQGDSRLIPHHPFFTARAYLGKRRIFLGVISILSMHLRLHTLFTYHQKVYTGRFYLRLSSATICEEYALCEV